MGWASDIKRRALNLSRQAAEAVMADPDRAKAVARALGAAQRGKQALDEGQQQLMRALGLPGPGDFKGVNKSLAVLKRRTRALEEKLSEIAPPAPGGKPPKSG